MSGRGSASKTILIRMSACVYRKDATRCFDFIMGAASAAHCLPAPAKLEKDVLAWGENRDSCKLGAISTQTHISP